jgi:predicted TIM-barrel fold metal-dependent hydrolase
MRDPDTVIDFHTHPMLDDRPILGVPHPPGAYLQLYREVTLLHAVALVMAPRNDLSRTRRLNDQVVEIGQSSRGRFVPFGSVHPLDGDDALEEIDRVAGAGVKGLKLHPNTQDFDVADPAVERVVRRAAERNLPVLFDAYSPFDPAQPGKFVRLAMTVPEARIVLAHALGPRFPELVVFGILARYPWWKRQVWVDVSAMAEMYAWSPYAKPFAWSLRQVGIDRLLWGSDWPLGDPLRSLAALEALGFDRRERRAIAYSNAAALLGL